MGGGGGSSNSSNTTNQTDERIAASDSAIVVQLDTGATFDLNDPIVSAQIPDLIKELLEAGTGAFNESLAFARQGNEKSLSLIEQALKQNQSEDRQNLVDLLKWGTIITAVIVAGKVIKWH